MKTTLSVAAGLGVLAGLLVVAGLALMPYFMPATAAEQPAAAQAGGQPAAGQPAAGAWGDVKGQIVFDGDKAPDRPKINVNKDNEHCLSKGDLLGDEWVVNPKSKGVKWAVVWLAADDNVKTPAKKLPIHPNLAKSKVAEVAVDQPCCVYEPHVLAMRDDQKLVFKNSSPVAHNVNYQGGTVNPSGNPILNPGATHEVPAVQYAWTPLNVGCNIHGWMKSFVRVYDHPYFAVTDENGNFEIKDAPAGDYHLMVWHENIGIKDAKVVSQGGKKVTLAGQPISIKAGMANVVPPIALKPQQ